MNVITSAVRQPLLHFLLLGAALFVLFDWVGQAEDDARTIVVDKEALFTFLQFRARAFNPDLAEKMLAGLSDEEFDRLVEEYVREEVLYREALVLEMEQNDYIIKRRLIQKIEFITTGFIEAATEVGEDDISAWYDTHKDSYYVEPFVTFTHVFFNAEQRGPDAAWALATEQLVELNREAVPFTQGLRHGDRFLYHSNYVERTLDFVASHFGAPMAEGVFELLPDDTRWHGPFESEYGYHLVMLARKQDGRYPELDEVRDQVQDEAEREQIRERNDEAIQAIVDSYDVRVTYARDSGELDPAASNDPT